MKVLKKSSYILAFSIFLASTCGATHAAPNPRNDIDGDGYSDPVLVDIATGGTLNWTAVSGPSATTVKQQSTFGKVGNHLAIAPWFISSHASFAFVSLVNGKITWNALKDDGTTVQKSYGSNGNLVVSGADFDGNGVADAAIVSVASNGKISWGVYRNPFAPSTKRMKFRRGKQIIVKKLPLTTKVALGSNGDIPFFADPNGKGDWLGVLKSNRTTVYLKNPFTGRTKKFKLKDFTASSLGVLPLKQATGGNLLAFPVRSDTATDFYITTTSGALVRHTQVPGTGEILVGNFTNLTASQLAIQGDNSFTIYDVASDQTETKSWGSGIAADAININELEASPSPSPTPGSGSPIEHVDNPPPPNGTLANICTNMHPMDRSVLYKPGSGGTSDSRTGRPAFLWYDCNDQGVSNLYVLASNGQKIGMLALYPVVCPWVRFYSGYAPGSFDTGTSFMNKAKAASGSPYLYFYTKDGDCWGPVKNANGRSGGR